MPKRASKITVDALVERATSGKKFNRHILFRPSQVYYLLKDPFWIWCQYHAPKKEAVDETTRYDELRMRRGVEYEESWVRANFPDALKIEPDFGFVALRNTFRAMIQGAPAIYQPQLWDLGRESYGKGDLLLRHDSHGSDFGPFHYRVVEIKRSKTLQEYHVLQAAIYNQTLGLLQGHTPDDVTVVLKDTSENVPYAAREAELESLRTRWRELRDRGTAPEPKRPPDAANSPWRIYGNKRVMEQRDLLLLAGIQKREREKLRAAGIHRVDQLWDMNPRAVCEIIGDHYGNAAYLVAQAYKTGKPLLKPGAALDIPRARRLLYFDFETSDEVHPTEPAHTYLIGCYDAMRDQYVKFLARGAEDEGRIFEEFLDFVGEADDFRIYHWTDFEIRQMRGVMRRWPMLQGRLERLIDRCVDLKEAIQAAVYLPVPTFSIKSVARALGFHWRQKDIGAFQAMVYYWDYLKNNDRPAIDKAILYNEDDCLAMWHVDEELKKRIRDEG